MLYLLSCSSLLLHVLYTLFDKDLDEELKVHLETYSILKTLGAESFSEQISDGYTRYFATFVVLFVIYLFFSDSDYTTDCTADYTTDTGDLFNAEAQQDTKSESEPVSPTFRAPPSRKSPMHHESDSDTSPRTPHSANSSEISMNVLTAKTENPGKTEKTGKERSALPALPKLNIPPSPVPTPISSESESERGYYSARAAKSMPSLHARDSIESPYATPRSSPNSRRKSYPRKSSSGPMGEQRRSWGDIPSANLGNISLSSGRGWDIAVQDDSQFFKEIHFIFTMSITAVFTYVLKFSDLNLCSFVV